jgi:hypothetical protein
MFKKIGLHLVAVATLLVLSCKKEGEEALNTGTVNIEFKHKVGSEDLEFDSKIYTNAVGHSYEVRTLKYFISKIYFVKSDGTTKENSNPIYVDADDELTRIKANAIELPYGIYSSIGFTFGIDSKMNVKDTLTSVKENSMAWGMQGGGYHYMKLEGTYDSLGVDSVTKSFALHTGPTMGHSYDFQIAFDNTAFTMDENGLNIEITMDINEWFTDPNLYDFEEYGHMIMMKMDAQTRLKANGISVFSIDIK